MIRPLVNAALALAATFAAPAFADYVIAPTGGDITGARLSAQLADGDVSLAAASGDVVVNDTVKWSAHTLTLSAPSGRVNVNAVMTASGSAGLSLETGASEADGGVAVALTGSGFTGRVDFTGTAQSYRVNGTAYTLIRTLAELEAVRPSAGGTINGGYALAADVDWSGAASQTSLGILGVSGRFDGLGHQLLGLAIPGNTDDTGLFSSADGGAVIRNLGVRGGSVSGGGWVGALVGNSSGVLSHVYSTADVSGTLFVGGLVGFQQGDGSLVAHAWAGGNVTGTGAVGGLVGNTSGIAVDNVWASGNVTGTSSSIGGLVGAADLGSTLRNAYATGNVTGSLQVGGLVGYNRGLVEHVFATGGVSASSNSYVGGLVGHNPTGAGGSVSDGWFAGDTPGAHPDNGAGTAIPLANLISALPGGFDAAVWANQNGKTTPYLQSVPGAVYVKAESANAAGAQVYTPVLTLQQLQAISDDLAGHFALFEDIDATATRGWNGGAGFAPIGNCTGGFNGRFDGLGHVVEDLFIHRVDALCVGLFGGLGIGGVVRNVGVDGGAVTGGSLVGGLVGYNDAGEISHAYAAVDVTAGQNGGGGLVGFTTGNVSDAYATGSVTVSGEDAGGLTGGNRGAIQHVWASGSVTGSGSNVGGLVGLAMDGTVADSHWDRFSSGQGDGVGVVSSNATVTNLIAVTSDPAQSAAADYAFKQGAYAGLDFGGTWVTFDGTRPFLQGEWQTTLGNAHQLQLMSLKLDAAYVLGRHVDAGETGRNDGTAATSNGMWAQTGFMRVGTDGPRFVGSLDGRYHVIGGLTINRPAIDAWVGLFGKTGGAVVKNLGMANVSITGAQEVGGLIGLSQGGVVSNVYVTGSVSGAGAVGGIIGAMQGGILGNAYASVDVTSTGPHVGGVLGGNAGSLHDVYATGSVSGPNAAGLVGYNADASGGLIGNGFWNIDRVGQGVGLADSAGGLTTGITGLSTSRWLSAGPIATGVWNAGNGWVAGYPYPLLSGFPHVLVVAHGAHVTQGVPAVSVDSYSVVDQDGIDASAWIEGTPSWFADPGLAAGAVANVGGAGVTMVSAYPFHQLTYLGSGVVQASPAADLRLALTQGSPDYVTYGQIVDYVVTLSNNGNAAVTNYAVSASYGGGADVGATTWQCIAGSIDASCAPAGNGPIVDSVTIPPGVSMTWLIHVPVATATLAGTLDFECSAEGLDPVADRATIVLFRDGFDGAQDTNFAR